MGLLVVDSLETLDYYSSKKYQRKLKKAGLMQLLKVLKKNQDQKHFKKFPKFGFEIEGHLLSVSTTEDGRKKFSLELHKEYAKESKSKNFEVTDEYGRWMLELIPMSPMEDFLYSGNLLFYTRNLYKSLPKVLKPEHVFLSTTLPPKFGTSAYLPVHEPPLTEKDLETINGLSNSSYMSDDIINTHPRFLTFTQNVRLRRGEKPQITAPIYPDAHTDMVGVLPGEKEPGRIHLDCFAFGMGMCSLQCTFGTASLDQARWLYDQYHMFTPLFVAVPYSSSP
jgi:glutamate--cysteine ligase catalytic subunit